MVPRLASTGLSFDSQSCKSGLHGSLHHCPRLAPLLGSALTVTPAYRGLADALRLLVADGRLPVGTRLPSERELTGALGVSRTTVTRAYAELRDRGYLTSRQGSGSVVALPPEAAGSRSGTALQPTADSLAGDVIDLTCASMGAPAGTVAAYERAVAALPAYLSGTGYHPLGLGELRRALADRFTERGLATSPDQVMVTSGALAGLAVTTRALLSTGDRVLVESPSYPNAIDTLRRSGARPVGMPVERTGWDTPGAVATLRQTAPRAAYLIPDFHNPTGFLMGDDQRQALGRALAGTRTVGIVDETLVDLAHDPGLVDAASVRQPPPADGHAGRSQQVVLGRAPRRVDPCATRPDAGPGERPTHPRPRRTGPGAAGADRAAEPGVPRSWPNAARPSCAPVTR